MAEEEGRTEYEFTYTYDNFTVFFYGNRVFIGKKSYPVGQCCVDILDLDDVLFDEINRRVKDFVPAACNLLIEKTDSAAVLAQERLNAVWELIFALPVYRDLKMDGPCNYHMFQRLMEDQEKWTQMQDPTSDGYFKYHGMLYELLCLAERLRSLKKMIATLTEKCLEPLKCRSSAAYAEAYSKFYLQILSAGIRVFGDNFEQGVPVDMSFVPMMHPTEEGAVFIAEKRRSVH